MKFHNESALRALFSHSNIGIIITDSKGVILEMNPFAEKMFGFSQNESMGLSIEALLPHKIRDKHIGLREKYMEAPTPRAMEERLRVRNCQRGFIYLMPISFQAVMQSK